MKIPFLLLCVAFHATHAAAQDHPHPHDVAPGGAAGVMTAGTVRLTAVMAENLGLQTAEVELKPMEKTFPALGSVEPEPGRVAAIASRVAGRVTELRARDGQPVKAGDVLMEVESRVVADPPPRLTFRAPIDGLVVETRVVSGGAVEPDQNLITIADLTEVDVVAQVFEVHVGAVRPGQAVHIRALAYPDLVFTGEVRATAAALDRDTGTLRVFVHAKNPERKLLPGMRAQLAFVTSRSEDAVVVPREAVLGEAGDLFVFREIAAGPFAYERTPVVVGLRDDRYCEIIDGVLPGDRVVTRGNYQLQFAGGGAQMIEDDHGHSHGPDGHKH